MDFRPLMIMLVAMFKLYGWIRQKEKEEEAAEEEEEANGISSR